MRPVRIIRNENIERVLIGVPKGHKHLRVYMKLKDAALIFQEATIANILRAYLTIKTHSTIRAQELKMHTMKLDENKAMLFINCWELPETKKKYRKN